MQPLTSRIRRLRDGASTRTDQIAVSVLVYLVAALLIVTCGVLYLRPPGRATAVFDISDAASIKPGNEVRVAGVTVGKVTAVRLGRNAAQVDLDIDSSVYVGDQSSIEVRMLTAAGGYFIALISNGAKPLGARVIPASHATPPYRLPDLLADASDKLEQINGEQLGQSLDSLANGLESNPGAVTTIVGAAEALARIVDRQQDQVRSVFDAAAELTHAAAANMPLVQMMLRQVALLESTLDTFKEGINQAFEGLGRLFNGLIVASNFYAAHRDWVIDAMVRIDNALKIINTDIPRTIWNLGNFVDNFRALIAPGDKKDQPLLATDICAPIEGRSC